jgi:hypothetical protein
MANPRSFSIPQSAAGAAAVREQPAADALTQAIRKAADALDAAAGEAAMGRLGSAKLGLLVAASGLLDALNAADAEFERRYAGPSARRPDRQVTQHGSDTHAV